MKIARLFLPIALICALLWAPAYALENVPPVRPVPEPLDAITSPAPSNSEEDGDPLEIPHLYSPELDRMVRRLAIIASVVLVGVIVASIVLYFRFRQQDDEYDDLEDEEAYRTDEQRSEDTPIIVHYRNR